MVNEWKPMKVEEVRKKLQSIVTNLKYAFDVIDEAEKKGIPAVLVTTTYNDILKLQGELVPILEAYEDFLNMFANGEIMYNTGSGFIPWTQSESLTGKNAPAYKHNINEKLMYQLYKENVSINEIARRVGCSADTVKRRIYKIKQSEKKDRKI